MELPAIARFCEDSHGFAGGISAELEMRTGTLFAFDSGAFTYQPDSNFWGTDSFSYRASDGLLTSSSATVTIHVAAVEEPPEIFSDGFESGDMAGWSLAVP